MYSHLLYPHQVPAPKHLLTHYFFSNLTINPREVDTYSVDTPKSASFSSVFTFKDSLSCCISSSSWPNCLRNSSPLIFGLSSPFWICSAFCVSSEGCCLFPRCDPLAVRWRSGVLVKCGVEGGADSRAPWPEIRKDNNYASICDTNKGGDIIVSKRMMYHLREQLVVLLLRYVYKLHLFVLVQYIHSAKQTMTISIDLWILELLSL